MLAPSRDAWHGLEVLISSLLVFIFCPLVVPLPPPGELTIMDVTHSSMLLNWDSAPGLVRKYIITYKPAEGESKEVSSLPITLAQISYHDERVPRLLVNVVPQELFILNNPSRF